MGAPKGNQNAKKGGGGASHATSAQHAMKAPASQRANQKYGKVGSRNDLENKAAFQ